MHYHNEVSPNPDLFSLPPAPPTNPNPNPASPNPLPLTLTLALTLTLTLSLTLTLTLPLALTLTYHNELIFNASCLRARLPHSVVAIVRNVHPL